jgi:hypothetical protein
VGTAGSGQARNFVIDSCRDVLIIAFEADIGSVLFVISSMMFLRKLVRRDIVDTDDAFLARYSGSLAFWWRLGAVVALSFDSFAGCGDEYGGAVPSGIW